MIIKRNLVAGVLLSLFFIQGLAFGQNHLINRVTGLDPAYRGKLEKWAGIDVYTTDVKGRPTIIGGDIGFVKMNTGGPNEKAVLAHIKPFLDMWGLKRSDFNPVKSGFGKDGNYLIQYIQIVGKEEIEGSDLSICIRPSGAIYGITSHLVDNPRKVTNRRHAPSALLERLRAKGELQKTKLKREKAFWRYSPHDADIHHVYLIEGSDANDQPVGDYYVDEETGETILSSADRAGFARQVKFMDGHSDTGAFGAWYRWDTAAPTVGAVQNYSNPQCNKVFDVLQISNDFFTSNLGWESYWNIPGNIAKAYVDMSGFPSANFSQYSLSKHEFHFGQGTGPDYEEVIAHEFTHSVLYTMHPDWINANNTGAINEGLADFFGAAVKAKMAAGASHADAPNEWPIDETVWIHRDSRRLDKPWAALHPTIDYWAQLGEPQAPTVVNDNGWTHYKSTLCSLALKLLVTGGTHPRSPLYVIGSGAKMPALGWDKTLNLVWTYINQYWEPSDQFDDFASKLILNEHDSFTQSVIALTFDALEYPIAGDNIRPANLSTSTHIVPGQYVTIGSIISGGGSQETKNVLIRGIGPALTRFGYGANEVPSDTRITLYQTGVGQIGYNDNWWAAANQNDVQAATAKVGAFPLTSSDLDAAILTPLHNGYFSVKIEGDPGLVLAELYDTDINLQDINQNSPMKISNVSSLARLESGNTVKMGIVVAGAGIKHALIRGVGPTLGNYAVPNPASDPRLRVYLSGCPTPIYENTKWHDAPNFFLARNAASALGAFALPDSALDAAFYASLPQGVYIIEIDKGNGSSGAAMSELYLVE